MLRLLITAVFAAVLVALWGCREQPGSRQPATSHATYASTLIRDVPHVRQKPDFCGEAAAAGFLNKLGKPYDQDDVFAMSGMDPARGMGATTRELKTALERIGFDVGQVWYRVEAAQASEQLARLFDDLHGDLDRGVPSIVCMHYDDQPDATEHFRLVLGYVSETDEIVYHEAAVDDGAYRRMRRDQFFKLWPLKYDPERWHIVRLRLDPGELDDPLPFEGHTPAAFAQHVMALRERLPRGFTVVIEPPFVVIGDGDPDDVRKRARRTVRWAVKKLKQAYFSTDPEQIIDVWLFKDARSYAKHTWEIFEDKPTTPYGYFSHKHKALIMNIATGGGTLIHEIVHPYVAANFPDCPAWFNEGLGSLYEAAYERDDHIIGLTNWRLPGLQRAIRAGKVPSFQKLMATTNREFRDQDPGTNYAQSRYLLYYLQEHGLLHRYYHAFYDDRDADPTGYKTLKRVLGVRDMQAFQQRWQTFVLNLRWR